MTTRKPSVFAQRMKALREQETRNSDVSSPFIRAGPDNVAGVQMDTIRSENEAFLRSLSKDEIEEKQRELHRILSPASIAFLKKRSSGRKSEEDSPLQPPNKPPTQKNSNAVDIKEPIQADVHPENSNENRASGCDLERKVDKVHLDTMEHEKFKWMEDVPTSVKSLPDNVYSARFDFEGNLLPFIVEGESTCSKGLYHHGEEPERPGYTFEELFQLSRSSFPRQRVVALNTIAAILENEFSLSLILETELLPELLSSGIFLILRFALDERLMSVYLAGLRAMSALLWRTADMHYLTDAIGVFGDMRLPSFEVNNSALDSANKNELKDSELIALDVIRGAVRTNLVQRLKYILDDMFPVDDRILPIIKCLTRIAYHSEEAAQVILNTPLLLEKLFAICRLPSESQKLYTAKLLMLFRVMACRSEELTQTLCTRFDLVPYILGIISDPVTRTSTVSQCVYLWHILLYRRIAVESVSQFSPVLFNLLRQLADRSTEQVDEGDIVLANALITLLILLFDEFPESVVFLRPTAQHLGCQWLNMFFNGEQSSRNFVKLISNSFYMLTCTKAAEQSVVTSLLKIVKWERLLSASKSLHDDSYLLNAVKTNFTDSLPSLCLPTSILIADNNIVLTHAVVKHLLRSDRSDCAHSATLVDNLWQFYVSPVTERAHVSQIAVFWPARFEIAFLCDILFLSARQTSLPAPKQKRILSLAFTLLRLIHQDDGDLIDRIFGDILFNEYLHDQITSFNLRTDDIVVSNVEYLEAVKQIFANQLDIPKTKATLTSTKRGTECAMPTDWFYVPILKVSNAFQDSSRNSSVAFNHEKTTKVMDYVLRWIRFVEYISNDVKTDMTLSTRFCRVCCVFFCGDIFLELNHLLADILNLLLNRNDELEFSTPIPGLSSFYDFYRDFCEQFASCSYGDPVFGAYLMVPLQQKHDVRLRLYFWSEQTVALRFLTTTVEQLPLPLDRFLQPNERNVQLVETYLNMIARGQVNERRNPVLYRIAIHHVASFLQSYENESACKHLTQKVSRIGNEYLKNCILKYNYSESNSQMSVPETEEK